MALKDCMERTAEIYQHSVFETEIIISIYFDFQSYSILNASLSDDYFTGSTHTEYEKEVASDLILVTVKTPFKMLIKIIEQANPANLDFQLYGNRAASFD